MVPYLPKWENTIGLHICNLDSCPGPEGVRAAWTTFSIHHHAALWILPRMRTQNLQARRTDPSSPVHAVFFIGDSTAGQQWRSFKCILEEAEVTEGWRAEHISITKAYGNGESVEDIISRFTNTLQNEIKHVYFVLALGAWYNCGRWECDPLRQHLKKLQIWWDSKPRNKAMLIVRDPLPQHFPTSDGRYHGYIRHMQDVGAKEECRGLDCKDSGRQAVKLVPFIEAIDASSSKSHRLKSMVRLPVWGVSSLFDGLHNIRYLDCVSNLSISYRI
jgi:hypothetical protein